MDDLISRQAAIRWVKTECNPYGKPTLDFESGKKVIGHLKNMPPAQTEHGRWMHYAHREPQYDISGVKTWGEEYQCSNCGFVHLVIEDFGHYAYCPNCGAKMDEEWY